mmetsp:Transcript_6887/g.22153  ORF Transcript_6887/g.22153 Transcript_6887/m.22153 type:complete len:280 (+) Transcript_6887:356-1195(+)
MPWLVVALEEVASPAVATAEIESAARVAGSAAPAVPTSLLGNAALSATAAAAVGATVGVVIGAAARGVADGEVDDDESPKSLLVRLLWSPVSRAKRSAVVRRFDTGTGGSGFAGGLGGTELAMDEVEVVDGGNWTSRSWPSNRPDASFGSPTEEACETLDEMRSSPTNPPSSSSPASTNAADAAGAATAATDGGPGAERRWPWPATWALDASALALPLEFTAAAAAGAPAAAPCWAAFTSATPAPLAATVRPLPSPTEVLRKCTMSGRLACLIMATICS